MAANEFNWLSDIEAQVRAKIDQKRGEPGQDKWDAQELSAAFNSEHRYLYERISSMDRDFNLLVDDTLTVAVNTETTDLPAGTRVVRSVFELNAAGDVVREINVGAWHEMGGGCNRDALYRPYPQAQLFWLNKPKQAFDLRVVYGAYPPHLFHGCVQGSGAAVVELERFEPADDGHGVGRDILIYEGTAEGTERTGSSYSGVARELTVTVAFGTLPTTRSRYTSRPDLPLDAKDAFVYGVCARLVEKFRDSRFSEFTAQRMEKLNSAFTALNTLDRRGALETYDMDTFGHGDPDWDYGY